MLAAPAFPEIQPAAGIWISQQLRAKLFSSTCRHVVARFVSGPREGGSAVMPLLAIPHAQLHSLNRRSRFLRLDSSATGLLAGRCWLWLVKASECNVAMSTHGPSCRFLLAKCSPYMIRPSLSSPWRHGLSMQCEDVTRRLKMTQLCARTCSQHNGKR